MLSVIASITEYVDWQLVAGTLKKGFEWYVLLQHPFAKAIYTMFLISEVHPFLDGNGRVARVMMNAELSSQNLSKIIYSDCVQGRLYRRLKKTYQTANTGCLHKNDAKGVRVQFKHIQ